MKKHLPIFTNVFGRDWEQLPQVFKKHYANRPYSNDECYVEGKLTVYCRGIFRWMSPLLWLLKGIPPKNDPDADVTVTFRSEPDTEEFWFYRRFIFSDKKRYTFASRMVHLKDNIVVEIMPFRIGWKVAYAWQNNKVLLRHKGYMLYFFGRCIPLPVTWLLGEGYAEETEINEDTFEMFTHISHPLWGKLYGYHGRFTFKENSV